jgi:uncharacterized protein YjiS (DUF1127 family)
MSTYAPVMPRRHTTVAAWWRHCEAWYRAALERRRQRIALARLDDHLLRDIGVTQAVAAAEAAKPFWR